MEMKLLPLLFLFLSFGVKGQEYSISPNGDTIGVYSGKKMIPSGFDYDEHYGRFGATPLPVRPIHNPLPKFLSLEEKLLLYAQECWNDSTLKSFHKGKICEPINQCCPEMPTGLHQLPKDYWEKHCMCPEGWCKTRIPEHWYKKYIHRKPTFEGFIEWLQKYK